jgi:hypothetical protein
VSASVSPKGEPLFEPPESVGPVTAVRGSLLVIDWRWLRENGLFDAYSAALGRRTDLLEVNASEWVPFPLGMEHWRALDALGLPPSTETAIGKFLGEHVHNVVLNTLVRLAGKLGMTPWAALAQSHKLWQRSWQGGGMAVYRSGDHAARVEVLNCAALQMHSLRNGFLGTIEAGIAPLCKSSILAERADERTHTSMVLRVSWQP